MLANQIAVHNEIFCVSDTPLPAVFQMLLENNCQCVVIVESLAHKNPIGVVTEHDICLKTITEGLNPQRLLAGRVMNGQIITVSSEARVEECAEVMKRTKTERLVVIDQEGAFSGIITGELLPKENQTMVVHHLRQDIPVTCPVVSRELHLAY